MTQSVKKKENMGEFHRIGATIQTSEEIQCFPYAGFSFNKKDLKKNLFTSCPRKNLRLSQ